MPALVSRGGGAAVYAFREFFDAALENENTVKAYRGAVRRFLTWAESEGLDLRSIAPGQVAVYIRKLVNRRTGNPASKPTQKLHLAAIRQFFNALVVRHAVVLNPALSVKGPRESVTEGKTPAIGREQVRAVFASIDLRSVVGLRDRAILGVLAYTGVRAGAVARLRLRDYSTDGTQWWLRFREKGGKVRDVPVRYDLQGYIDEYVAAAGIRDGDRGASLFRATNGRVRQLSERPLSGDTVLRMVQRRFADAGLPEDTFTCHSFRAAVATDLLTQGVPLEDVQYLLGHSDPRTTRLYDRRQHRVTRNIVERISH